MTLSNKLTAVSPRQLRRNLNPLAANTHAPGSKRQFRPLHALRFASNAGGLIAGWDGLIGFVTVAITALGVLLAWFAVIALIVFANMWPLRRRRAHRPTTPPVQEPVFATPPAPPAPPAE